MVPLVQKEINIFRESIWNSHRIRAQKETALPDGIPNHIFSFPIVNLIRWLGRPAYFKGFSSRCCRPTSGCNLSAQVTGSE